MARGRSLPAMTSPYSTRTLLPQLVGAGLLEASEIPRELAELSPTECSLQFYLDRDEHGVQCEVKARYGDAIVPLLPDGPTVHAEGERSIPCLGA